MRALATRRPSTIVRPLVHAAREPATRTRPTTLGEPPRHLRRAGSPRSGSGRPRSRPVRSRCGTETFPWLCDLSATESSERTETPSVSYSGVPHVCRRESWIVELSIVQRKPAHCDCASRRVGARLSRELRRFGSTARWTLTIAATAASTLALEAVATAAGVLLAASHVLDGAHRTVVLGVLATTYVVWVAGLRVSLRANWRLLDETGTSTNACSSKMAFELARLRSCSPRRVRATSAVGYVATEVAKEATYYAGAFGTALVSSSVDAMDALVFLGGANLGAAVYEYGVARLVRGLLGHRPDRLPRPRSPLTEAVHAWYEPEHSRSRRRRSDPIRHSSIRPASAGSAVAGVGAARQGCTRSPRAQMRASEVRCSHPTR